MRILFIREPGGAWRRLTIDDSRNLLRGKEGIIYESSSGELALKLFIKFEDAYLQTKHRKIRHMLQEGFVQHFIKAREYPDFAWPICTVHSEQTERSFVGFGMRKLVGYQPLDSLFSSTDSDPTTFNELKRVQICSYMSHLIAVCHAKKVLVGDVKPDNIYVHSGGDHVALVDCDSFQMSSNEVDYTTDVGTREYASPRLIQVAKRQGGGSFSLNGLHREFGDDTFALGVICFRLLMSGYHPFHTTQADGHKSTIFENIQERIFPYAGGFRKPHKNAPVAKYEKLPAEVRTLFESAFSRSEYVSAIRWRDAFYEYGRQLERPAVKSVLTLIEQAQVMPMPAPKSGAPKIGLWGRVRRYLRGG